MALVLFRHFPAPISHPCRSRFPVPPSKQSVSLTSRRPFHLSFRSNLHRSCLPCPQHSISHQHHFRLQLSTRHLFQPLLTLFSCSPFCPFLTTLSPLSFHLPHMPSAYRPHQVSRIQSRCYRPHLHFPNSHCLSTRH